MLKEPQQSSHIVGFHLHEVSRIGKSIEMEQRLWRNCLMGTGLCCGEMAVWNETEVVTGNTGNVLNATEFYISKWLFYVIWILLQ